MEILNLISKRIIFIGLAFAILFFCLSCVNKEKKSSSRVASLASEPVYTMPGLRPIPYKLGKTYKFIFTTDKGKIGEGLFKMEKSSDGNLQIFSSVDVNDIEALIQTKGEGTLILNEKFEPVSYERSMLIEYKDEPEKSGTEIIKAAFQNGKANLEIVGPSKDQKQTMTVDYIPGYFAFDNNFLGQMAFLCSQPKLKSGRAESLNVLSITLRSMLLFTMTPRVKVALEYKGRKIIAYEVDMKADGTTFGRYFITPDGVLVKAEEMGGLMLIELENPDFPVE